MIELIVAILVAYGMTNIIVNGAVFDGFRRWIGTKSSNQLVAKLYQLLTCMMCTGFWVGMGVGYALGMFATYPVWLSLLFSGSLMSGTTWVMHCLSTALGGGYDPSITVNVLHEGEE